MIGRIVEIASEGCYVSVDRGFMVISHGGEERGRVPIDDVMALIGNGHGAIFSSNLLLALAKRGTPVVLCGPNHSPAGILWPVDSHHQQAGRLDLQVALTRPRRNQLWKQLVRSKLQMQAHALRLCGKSHVPVQALVRKVTAGDSTNVEGQGARAFWTLLFGKSFRRDRDAEGLNSLLNYAYAIVRSTVARRVMACGLNPALGIHHSNDGNPMRLVDDLMEPFRSVADVTVWRLVQQGSEEVNQDTKRELATLAARTLLTDAGRSPLSVVVERLCRSYVSALTGGELELPHGRRDVLSRLWDDPSDEHEQPIPEAQTAR